MKPSSILVTEDESSIRLTLRVALESDGYEVREAANGREALDAMAERAPDLVILDLNMPVLDGMAVLEQMKSLTLAHRPRVVVLTAYGSVAAAVKATRLGAVDFLEKPITPGELRQTVRSVLEEPELDSPKSVQVDVPGGYEQVLTRIRRALHANDLAEAQALLEVAAEQRNQQAAEYFNLLGVLYEVQQKWRLARKCYGRSASSGGPKDAAQANLRRLYELHTYGKSAEPVALEDPNKGIAP